MERCLVDGKRCAPDGEEAVGAGVGAAHSGLLAVVLDGTSDDGDLIGRKEKSDCEHLLKRSK